MNESFNNKFISELDNWVFATDNYTTAEIGSDSKLTFRHTNDTGTDTSGTYSALGALNLQGVLEEDKEHGTDLLSRGFSGKYAIELDLDAYIHTQRATATFAALNFGVRASSGDIATAMTETQFFVRITGTTDESNNTGILRLCRMNGTSTQIVQSLDFDMNKSQTLKFVVDTNAKNFDYYVNGKLQKSGVAFSDGTGEMGLINAVQLRTMRATSEGSYVKLSYLKVYELERNTSDPRYIEALEKIQELPETLTANPKTVTDNIDLPVGFTWKSGNELFCGSDGVINRWVESVDTYLQTSVSSTAGYSVPMELVKRYRFTVAAVEGAQNEVVYDEDYTTAPKLRDWEFNEFYESENDNHICDERGLVFTKGSGADSTINYDLMSYYGLGLLGEKLSSDNERIEVIRRELKGVYDIDFDAQAFVSSSHPATVELGYLNAGTGRFTSVGTIAFTSNGASLQTAGTSSQQKTQIYGELPKSVMSIRLRIDTVEHRIYPYTDGKLLNPFGIAYTDETGTDMVNAIRISMDKNMPEGDSFILKKLQVVKRMSESNAEADNLKNAADMLPISVITDNPEQMTQMKTLPETVNGVSLIWTVDSNFVDIKTGQIYQSDTQQEITLTVRLISGNYMIDKSFRLTIPPTDDALKILEYYAKNITLENITNQNTQNLLYDIELPTEFEVGTISWNSSKPAVIDKTGKINTASLISDNTEVTLTAALADKKGNKVEKTFKINVARRAPEQEIYSSNQAGAIHWDGIENGKIPSNIKVKLTVNALNSENGSVEFLDTNGRKALQLDIVNDEVRLNGNKIAQLVEGSAEIALFISPELGKIAAWNSNGELMVDYGETYDKISEIAEIRENGVEVSNITIITDGFGLLATAFSNIDYLAPFDGSRIHSDIEMVTDGFLNVQAVWASDRNDVISADGKFNTPPKTCEVNLTLTLSLTDMPEVQKTVTVGCIAANTVENNAALGKPITSSNLESQYPSSFAVDGDDTTFMQTSLDDGVTLTMTLDGNTWINTVGLLGSNAKGYTLYASSDGNTWNKLGSSQMGDGISQEMLEFSAIAPKYLRLEFDAVSGQKLELYEWECWLLDNGADKEYIDVNSIDLPSTITSNVVTLPIIGSVYKTALEWSSSNTSVISNDGAVTIPKNDTYVTLTVSGGNSTKSFRVLVKGTNGSSGGTVIGGGGGGGAGSSVNPAFPVFNNTMTTTTPNTPSAQSPNTISKPNRQLFKDTTLDDWYYEAVQALAYEGIINGDGNGNFNPAAPVKREEFVKMVVLAFDCEVTSESGYFKDVSANDWYAPYIGAAFKASITEGISDDLFGVGSPITRQDVSSYACESRFGAYWQ